MQHYGAGAAARAQPARHRRAALPLAPAHALVDDRRRVTRGRVMLQARLLARRVREPSAWGAACAPPAPPRSPLATDAAPTASRRVHSTLGAVGAG
jgi:hypothetical protein